MVTDLNCSNFITMFKNKRQYDAFVKVFCKNDNYPDYLTWKTNTEKKVRNANKRGEKIIAVYPQFDLLLNWIKEHPNATEEERRAKLVAIIV